MADVYDRLGTAFECSVDVKSPDAAAALVDVGRRHDALERLWVCSPDLDVLRELRHEPTREAGALASAGVRSRCRSNVTRTTSGTPASTR